MDDAALIHLTEDIEEFKSLVPQAGLRLKIKTVVRKVCVCTIHP